MSEALRDAALAIGAGDHARAVRLLEAHTHGAPDDADAWYALGVARFDLRDHEGAEAALARVLAMRPGSVGARVILGTMRYLDGRPDEGFELHTAALAIETENPRHLTARALLRVARGDWARGWAEYETRWSPKVGYRIGHAGHVALDERRWTGEPLPDGVLCVHPEAGLGDTILFARLLPALAARVGPVVVADTQPALRRLLDGAPGVAALADVATRAQPGVRHVSLYSLPWALGLTEATVPRDVPYLRAPKDGPTLPPRRSDARIRVGIVWAGEPSAHLDHDRSVPRLALLTEALRAPGVEWVSLQLGPRACEGDAFGVVPMPPVRDLADTAHLLNQLDLVLSIDSSVANLAGALGVSTWVLVPTHPEFRWTVHRPDSPWFPTVRIFRRRHTGDWGGVATRLREALDRTVAERDRGA